MKDRSDRAARLQLIEYMFAGQSWRAAAAQSQLKISRSTAYRLVQLARDEEKAAEAFLDDRHGHPYKVTDKVASVARRGMYQRPADSFQPDPSRVEEQLWHRSQCRSHQPHAGKTWSDQAKAWSSSDSS
jgi:transposase